MSINVFEGARRIRLLLQILLGAGCIGFAMFFNRPYISTTFELSDPGVGWMLAKQNCNYATDETRYPTDDIELGEGYATNATFCFRSQPFKNDQDGSMMPLFAYKIEKGGDRLFNTKETPEVRAYLDRQEAAFRPTTQLKAEALAEAKRDWWAAYSNNWRDAVLMAAIGSALLWGFSWVIGWIARGFAGIPRGQDKRPN